MRLRLCRAKKAAPEPRWPEFINGHRTRPEHGPCPECGAASDEWCEPACPRLDPMDYR